MTEGMKDPGGQIVDGQLSAREIAERLGVGKSAITMRLERSRARVKRELMMRVLARRV